MNAATLAGRISLFDGLQVQLGRRPPDPAVAELPPGVERLVAHVCLFRRPEWATVAGLLWPEVPPDDARRALRSTLRRLDESVPGLVEVSGGALTLARAIRVDVREFRVWARQALDPRVDVGALGAPDVAFAGDLLPGWSDDWVLLEREQLRQLRMHALEAVADKLARAGRHGEAARAARAAVRVEPLRETAHRLVIRVHIAEGRTAEAAEAYEAFRSLLAQELGVRPTRRMEDLVERIGALPPRDAPTA